MLCKQRVNLNHNQIVRVKMLLILYIICDVYISRKHKLIVYVINHVKQLGTLFYCCINNASVCPTQSNWARKNPTKIVYRMLLSCRVRFAAQRCKTFQCTLNFEPVESFTHAVIRRRSRSAVVFCACF